MECLCLIWDVCSCTKSMWHIGIQNEIRPSNVRMQFFFKKERLNNSLQFSRSRTLTQLVHKVSHALSVQSFNKRWHLFLAFLLIIIGGSVPWFVYYLFDITQLRCRNMHVVCAKTNFVISTREFGFLIKKHNLNNVFSYHDFCLHIQLIVSLWSHCFVILPY